MITHEDACNLVKVTMVDCPLPDVADMLTAIGPGDKEAEIMFDFLKSHYTRGQLRNGIAEYGERVRFMNELFGNRGAPE